PANVTLTRVTSASEMRDAVLAVAGDHQIVIKAAAVSDFTPVEVADRKIKKQPGVDELTLRLKKTPDILGELGASTPRPFIVAFAAETDSVEAHAREKLTRKNADLIVANDVADSTIGFDSEQNEVLVIARDGSVTRLARAPKRVIADRILDLVVTRVPS
ncbi:MAG TPA: phosphopantothenoylcysteine decarboxylase, partial [Thermoanaerobaculia bacterium]|nr:phosphopantothenoylcysteine decarboxylase [Thermoanaerobaculia bacterium]